MAKLIRREDGDIIVPEKGERIAFTDKTFSPWLTKAAECNKRGFSRKLADLIGCATGCLSNWKNDNRFPSEERHLSVFRGMGIEFVKEDEEELIELIPETECNSTSKRGLTKEEVEVLKLCYETAVFSIVNEPEKMKLAMDNYEFLKKKLAEFEEAEDDNNH